MAAAAVEAVQREKEVRVRGGAERGHASGAREEDHQGPRRHDTPQVPQRQEGLPRVRAGEKACVWSP